MARRRRAAPPKRDRRVKSTAVRSRHTDVTTDRGITAGTHKDVSRPPHPYIPTGTSKGITLALGASSPQSRGTGTSSEIDAIVAVTIEPHTSEQSAAGPNDDRHYDPKPPDDPYQNVVSSIEELLDTIGEALGKMQSDAVTQDPVAKTYTKNV